MVCVWICVYYCNQQYVLSNKWLFAFAPVLSLKVDVLQENIAKLKGIGPGITQDNRKLGFKISPEFLEDCKTEQDKGDLECGCLGFFDAVQKFIKVSSYLSRSNLISCNTAT